MRNGAARRPVPSSHLFTERDMTAQNVSCINEEPTWKCAIKSDVIKPIYTAH